jgi:hypothetical protein
MNEVKTTAELLAALDALPEFSRKVYEVIKAGLYAEPGFSDIESSDVAATLKCSPLAVNAALGHLIEAGLVFVEPWETFGNPKRNFIHTYEHDNEISRG